MDGGRSPRESSIPTAKTKNRFFLKGQFTRKIKKSYFVREKKIMKKKRLNKKIY